MEPNADELYGERLRKIEEEEQFEKLRMIAFPSEEAIECAILRMEERDFFGYILHAYLKKTARWYSDQYLELDRLPEAIIPGEESTYSFSEREARLLAWVVQEFNAELRHRIACELRDNVRTRFESDLRNYEKGRVTGQPYCGPDYEGFVVDSSTAREIHDGRLRS